MAKEKKILEIDLNGVKFSHGIMRGAISLGQDEQTLLSGDNGAGKSSLIQFFKSRQKELFDDSVFFIDQDELALDQVLSSEDLSSILKQSLPHRVNTQRLYSFLEATDSQALFSKPTATLSGGERQLMKLALGFMIEAKIYILDEPFNNLSVQRREMLRSFIKNLKANFLIVDHFSSEWADWFDKYLVMSFRNSEIYLETVDGA